MATRGHPLSFCFLKQMFQKSSLSKSDFPPPLALAVGTDY